MKFIGILVGSLPAQEARRHVNYRLAASFPALPAAFLIGLKKGADMNLP